MRRPAAKRAIKDPPRLTPARSFATLVLASLEGAFVLCRARGDIAALDRVQASLVAAAPAARR